jgi:hypothetical protein
MFPLGELEKDLDVLRLIPRCRLLAVLLLLAWAPSASATTIAYWRMEVDNQNGPNKLSVDNEVASGSALTSNEAFVDTVAGPNGTIPLTSDPNDGSIGSTRQGPGDGINATAAWYPELDVSSITIEFWARTVEAQATLFSRTSGGADGIILENPNSLDLTYYTEDGLGGVLQVQLLDLWDMDANWSHFSFSYDEANGVGVFRVDGNLVAMNDGPDGAALVWGNQVDLQIGWLMDYADSFNGTLDEFRILDGPASAADPFLIPEPRRALTASLGLLGLFAAGTRRSR